LALPSVHATAASRHASAFLRPKLTVTCGSGQNGTPVGVDESTSCRADLDVFETGDQIGFSVAKGGPADFPDGSSCVVQTDGACGVSYEPIDPVNGRRIDQVTAHYAGNPTAHLTAVSHNSNTMHVVFVATVAFACDPTTVRIGGVTTCTGDVGSLTPAGNQLNWFAQNSAAPSDPAGTFDPGAGPSRGKCTLAATTPQHATCSVAYTPAATFVAGRKDTVCASYPSYQKKDPNSAGPVECSDLTIEPANQTTTSLTATPDPAYAGRPVRLTGIASDGSGVPPAGKMSFYNGENVIASCGNLPMTNGAAVCVHTFAAGTTPQLFASYLGSPGVGGSTSAELDLKVIKQPTTTTLAVTSKKHHKKRLATMHAAVVPQSGGTPEGILRFTVDGHHVKACDVGLDAANHDRATCRKKVSKGRHKFVVAFAGDADFAASSAVKHVKV
jgi:hypothetical protein